jgi:hypothetical protein
VIEDVPKAEIARDLDRDFLHAPVQGSINAFLINTGSKLILVDSGAGVRASGTSDRTATRTTGCRSITKRRRLSEAA